MKTVLYSQLNQCNDRANIKHLIFDSMQGVTAIPPSIAKGMTNLKKVTICNGWIDLGEDAFYDCQNLAIVDLPESLKAIHPDAFAKTGIKDIILPDNITFIGSCAFAFFENLRKVSMSEQTYTMIRQIGHWDQIFKGTALQGKKQQKQVRVIICQ